MIIVGHFSIFSQQLTEKNQNVKTVQRIKKIWKTDEWIKKRWYMYKMEHYLATKIYEVLTDAITWMNLKNLINKRSHSQKTIRNGPFIWNVQNSKSIEISSCLGLREMEGYGVMAKQYWVSFWGDKRCSKIYVDNVFTYLWI